MGPILASAIFAILVVGVGIWFLEREQAKMYLEYEQTFECPSVSTAQEFRYWLNTQPINPTHLFVLSCLWEEVYGQR